MFVTLMFFKMFLLCVHKVFILQQGIKIVVTLFLLLLYDLFHAERCCDYIKSMAAVVYVDSVQFMSVRDGDELRFLWF